MSAEQDPKIKAFLAAFPRVKEDPGWKTFFASATVSQALDAIEKTLAPALNAVFTAEKGLITAAKPGAASAATADAEGEGHETLSIFSKTANLKECLENAVKVTRVHSAALLQVKDKTDPTDGAILMSLQKIEKTATEYLTAHAATVATTTPEAANELLVSIVTEAHAATQAMQKRTATLFVPSAVESLQRFMDLVKWYTKTIKVGLEEGDSARKAILYLLGYKHRRYACAPVCLDCAGCSSCLDT